MIIAISYGDKNFSQSLRFNLWTARFFGKADKVIKYQPSDIDIQFKEENKEIFSSKKGAGYWLWKPYVVNKTMKEIQYNDYLVYSDSGTFYMNNIKYLINRMEAEKTAVFIGELEFLEAEYSKRDAFIYIGVDNYGFELSKQLDASFFVFKKTQETEKIVEEWLSFSCNKCIISDDENVCGLNNYPGFIQNRYDQTVLSLVCKKYKCKVFRNASQPDPYFTCIEPVSILGKGKYKELYYNKKCRDILIKNYKENKNKYCPAIIVRTRFRNMNLFAFYRKTIIKMLKYIYRNNLSYCLTWIYVQIRG